MESMNATDVRKDFSAVVDMAVREKPVFIKRTRDNLILSDRRLMLMLLRDYMLTARRYIEDDGSITLSLEEIDLVVNAGTDEAAKDALVSDLREYADDYYENYAAWSVAPNRKDHLPYVIKVLATEDKTLIGAMIVCHDGAN